MRRKHVVELTTLVDPTRPLSNLRNGLQRLVDTDLSAWGPALAKDGTVADLLRCTLLKTLEPASSACSVSCMRLESSVQRSGKLG
jgi:hypothetical protein